jgi:hypothetical protein
MTHSEMPPGVAVLQRLKAETAYAFDETARGGIVRISTSNLEPRTALHEFLTYQIKERATGDPTSWEPTTSTTATADREVFRDCGSTYRIEHGRRVRNSGKRRPQPLAFNLRTEIA